MNIEQQTEQLLQEVADDLAAREADDTLASNPMCEETSLNATTVVGHFLQYYHAHKPLLSREGNVRAGCLGTW